MKIIILYSTGGMGHKKAALALLAAFKNKKTGLELEVETMDVLEYANRFYRFLYIDFYVFLMSRARWLWGFLYYFSNNVIVDTLTRKIRAVLDYNSLPRVGAMLTQKKADIIIATHFFLASIAEILKKEHGVKSKLYTVITDYGPHSWWLSQRMDKFFGATQTCKQMLIKRGITPEKIDVVGIPVGEEFDKNFDTCALYEKYGLDRAKKTIFLISGGFGVGPIREILLSLNGCRTELQVIAVCGHNKRICDNLRILQTRLDYPLVIFGFTDKVAELMSISNLMITKAGGISVTEAMNMHLPMILYASIPGQETWNEEFLLSSRAALKAKRVKDIPRMVEKIFSSDRAYESLKQNIDKVRCPDAARRIVDIVFRENGYS